MAARKTTVAPVRIWTTVARVKDEALVLRLLREANRYYNRLVEIERARHARFVDIRREHAPALAALEDAWEVADVAIASWIAEQKRARQGHWQETGGEKRRLLIEQAEAEIARLKAEQKRVSAEAKEHRADFAGALEPANTARSDRSLARAWVFGGLYPSDAEGLARIAEWRRAVEEAKAEGRPAPQKLPTPAPRHKQRANEEVLAEMLDEDRWPAVWRDIARSDAEADRLRKEARASCGLATGTYLGVEEAVEKARKDSSPRPPRFHAFRGEGRLRVQLTHLTMRDLRAGAPQCTIRPEPKDPNRKGRGAWLVTIDQQPNDAPRGAERRQIVLDIKQERRTRWRHDETVDDGARATWATLVVRRVGERTLYEFQLTLEHESFAKPKRPAGTRTPEHIRIGWARVDGGVRVASWSGGDIVVPDTILGQHEHAAAIKSAADRHFERAKEILRRWMRGGPHRLTAWHRMLGDRRREMMRDVCVAYARWVFGSSPVELRDIWIEWRTERRARGEDLYAPPWLVRRWLRGRGLEGQEHVVAFWAFLWAKKDRHLCQYSRDSERRFQHRREALFRQEANRIATEFSAVTIDSYRIAGLRELPSLTRPGEVPRERSQHNAHAAAPGRFRELLVEVMGPRCTPCERRSDDKTPGSARAKRSRKKSASTEQTRIEQQPARVDLSQTAT